MTPSWSAHGTLYPRKRKFFMGTKCRVHSRMASARKKFRTKYRLTDSLTLLVEYVFCVIMLKNDHALKKLSETFTVLQY